MVGGEDEVTISQNENGHPRPSRERRKKKKKEKNPPITSPLLPLYALAAQSVGREYCPITRCPKEILRA
ncbi:hypothetical protein ACLOJK_014989 [Asimina triloba]